MSRRNIKDDITSIINIDVNSELAQKSQNNQNLKPTVVII
jgi:hypothetical protein